MTVVNGVTEKCLQTQSKNIEFVHSANLSVSLFKSTNGAISLYTKYFITTFHQKLRSGIILKHAVIKGFALPNLVPFFMPKTHVITIKNPSKFQSEDVWLYGQAGNTKKLPACKKPD